MPEEGITIISSDDEEFSVAPTKRKKLQPLNYERNELLRKATTHIENLSNKRERDEADIYGEGWALSYRKLSAKQKLFAKKACDEIFVLGQLDKLTLNSVMTETSPFSTPLSFRSSSTSSIPQIISVKDVSNSKITPVYISKAPSPEVYYEEESLVQNRNEYSSFSELFTDNSFS